MRINGTLQEVRQGDGTAIVSFKINNIRHAMMAGEIDKDKLLSIEVKPAKSKRSAEQNRYMWALLHEIDVVMNGENSNAEWDIYCDALERAGAKFEYLMCRTEAEDMLKGYFRAVRYAMPAEDGFGWYKCYWGSSKMDTKEMTKLIDCILDMAAEAGIETSYWKAVLG